MRKPSRTDIVTAFALLAVGCLSLAGCNLSDQAVYAERGEEADAAVLAVVGSESITEEEVEDRMAAELGRLEQQRYDLLKRGLQLVVADRLVEIEAKERGITAEELLSEEVESKVADPTDEQVDAFYQERQAQIRQPKEQVADRIRDYLKQTQRSELERQLVDRLKEKHGYQILLEPIRTEVAAEGFPAKGPADAAVTIVEFSDFECPYCARINPTLQQVFEAYGDRVRLVFRQFPLNIHPKAQKAAEASLCARDQGKFWEMHDLMFSEQRSLGVDELKEKATRLELDTAAFDECLDSGRYAADVQADLQAGSAAGVSGTPALFINGRFLSGAQPFEALAEVIDEELARQEAGS